MFTPPKKNRQQVAFSHNMAQMSAALDNKISARFNTTCCFFFHCCSSKFGTALFVSSKLKKKEKASMHNLGNSWCLGDNTRMYIQTTSPVHKQDHRGMLKVRCIQLYTNRVTESIVYRIK